MERHRRIAPHPRSRGEHVTPYPDRRYFTRIAKDTGFRPEPLETVYRLTSLLNQVTTVHGPELSLRGGTALNLIHLDLPRLSVDIDLDYIGSADPDSAQQRRPRILASLEAISERAGYAVRAERASYAMAHLRLAYVNTVGRPAFLKLDVNFLDRVPVLPTEQHPLTHPFPHDLPEIMVETLALAELAAAKLVALARRSLPRDLFDSAMLSTLPNLDIGLMRTVLVVRGSSYHPHPRPTTHPLWPTGYGPPDGDPKYSHCADAPSR